MSNSIIKTILSSILIVSPLFASEWEKSNSENETQLFSVQVLESRGFEVKDTIEFSSTTEAHQRIEVKSEIMTTVDSVLVKAGSLVKKNDLVVKLDEYETNQELFELDLLSESEFKKIALYAPFDGILLDNHKIAGELVTPGERYMNLSISLRLRSMDILMKMK